MLIVSYYTEPYASHAEHLMRSLDELGLEYRVDRVDSLGNWQRNTQFKASFLRDMRREITGPIVWLDADAIVHRRPIAFEVLEGTADIGVHFKQPDDELLSGTIWLGDTDATRALLDRWVCVCAKSPTRWDQKCLHEAIGLVPGLRVHRLPAEYCCIFDSMRRANPGIDPVVEHFQASRSLKGVA